MWLLTLRGFFSVVQDLDHADGLLVRARTDVDLEALRELVPGIEPVHGQGTDYPWRAWVDRRDWAHAVEAMCAEIDYGNFKNAVAKHQGLARARLYGKVWAVLQELERVDE